MTAPLPPRDDHFARLWQSDAPPVDVDDVMRGIRHDARIHRLFNGVTLGLVTVAMVFVFWMDVRGFFRVPFLLSGALMASAVWKLWTMWRSSRRMSAVGSLGMTDLVRHAIARARVSLRTGRVLYAVNPLSLLLGIAIGRLLAEDGGSNPDLDLSVAGILLVLVAATGAGMIIGVRMARAARLRLAVLRHRLQAIEKDL